uniref:Uncharacterized protein n=1 Tax=Oryza punctata TaxID=4537 RepID=A0A0E0M058_ORYPU
MDYEALRMVCSWEFWRMAVLWTISLLYSYILLFIRRGGGGAPVPRRCRRPMPEPDDDAGRCLRPICVITGATSGLGKAAAVALAQEGYHVVLGESRTVQEIRNRQSDAYLEAFQVNLSSFKSIKKFETSLKQWIQDANMEHSIQLLVNNAGMLAKSYRITEDGFDDETYHMISRMMQANYIGPFVLTNILLPLLKNSSTPSRVVNLTAADPGVVQTGIMRELPPSLSWFAHSVLRLLNLLQQPDTGVGAVLDAALAPPEASGKYFFGGKGRTIRSSQLSYDVEVAKKLWAESLALFNELQIRECELRTS